MKRRKVPKRVPDFLRAEEVNPVLAHLSDRWRPLFATALYTGLHKGELFGLRKSNVDLPNRLLTVAHSYDRAPDGSMMPDSVQLEFVLRRAFHRVGIVEAWHHKCRRKGCGYVETARQGPKGPGKRRGRS